MRCDQNATLVSSDFYKLYDIFSSHPVAAISMLYVFYDFLLHLFSSQALTCGVAAGPAADAVDGGAHVTLVLSASLVHTLDIRFM